MCAQNLSLLFTVEPPGDWEDRRSGGTSPPLRFGPAPPSALGPSAAAFLRGHQPANGAKWRFSGPEHPSSDQSGQCNFLLSFLLVILWKS